MKQEFKISELVLICSICFVRRCSIFLVLADESGSIIFISGYYRHVLNWMCYAVQYERFQLIVNFICVSVKIFDRARIKFPSFTTAQLAIRDERFIGKLITGLRWREERAQ
jgi:hypothetical protein